MTMRLNVSRDDLEIMRTALLMLGKRCDELADQIDGTIRQGDELIASPDQPQKTNGVAHD